MELCTKIIFKMDTRFAYRFFGGARLLWLFLCALFYLGTPLITQIVFVTFIFTSLSFWSIFVFNAIYEQSRDIVIVLNLWHWLFFLTISELLNMFPFSITNGLKWLILLVNFSSKVHIYQIRNQIICNLLSHTWKNLTYLVLQLPLMVRFKVVRYHSRWCVLWLSFCQSLWF